MEESSRSITVKQFKYQISISKGKRYQFQIVDKNITHINLIQSHYMKDITSSISLNDKNQLAQLLVEYRLTIKQTLQIKIIEDKILKILQNSSQILLGGGQKLSSLICQSDKILEKKTQFQEKINQEFHQNELNAKNRKIYIEFLSDYQKYTCKKRVQNIIERDDQKNEMNNLLKNCILKYQNCLAANSIEHNLYYQDLFEQFIVYLITCPPDQTITIGTLNQLKESLDIFIKILEAQKDKQPILDMIFYAQLILKFNENRIIDKRLDEQRLNKIYESTKKCILKIFQLIQLGKNISSGDLIATKKLAEQIGKEIYDAYSRFKTQKLQKLLFDIYSLRIEKFEFRIWLTEPWEDAILYMGLFNKLVEDFYDEDDIIILILVRINYFLNKIILSERHQFYCQKINLNNQCVQYFLGQLINNCNGQQMDMGKLEKIKRYLGFVSKSEIFRFVSLSIQLTLKRIFDTNELDKNNQIYQHLQLNLYTKYITEQNQSVRQVFQFNDIFIQEFQQLNDTQYKDLSEKLVIYNQLLKQSQLHIKNEDEIEITSIQNLNNYFTETAIQQYLLEVQQRKQNATQEKDDILADEIVYYVNQKIKHKSGVNIITKQGVVNNKELSALELIKNNFLSDQNCKLLTILAQSGCGKSMLIKKLEYDLINQLIQFDLSLKNQNQEQTSQNNHQQQLAFQLSPIPFFIKMSNLDRENPQIETILMGVQYKLSKRQVDLFKHSERQKIILLDAFDEYSGNYFRVYNKLKFDEWKNTKVIVTCRKEVSNEEEQEYLFSIDDSNRQNYCIMNLLPFAKQDIILYIKNIFFWNESQNNNKDLYQKIQQQFNQDSQQLNPNQASNKSNDFKNEVLAQIQQQILASSDFTNLISLPINLYVFTRTLLSYCDQKTNDNCLFDIKGICDQSQLYEKLFDYQFNREMLAFIDIYANDFDTKQNQQFKQSIRDIYFIIFQDIAMKMFLNKGIQNNFLVLSYEDSLQLLNVLKQKINKILTKHKQSNQEENLFKVLSAYINSQIINRIKKENALQESTISLEFKHKSIFEYFAARAMKFDFDQFGNDLYKQSINILSEFYINKRLIMQRLQNQSEKQILLQLYHQMKEQIHSQQFQDSMQQMEDRDEDDSNQNYPSANNKEENIEKYHQFIQFIKRSNSESQDKLIIGASNLLSVLMMTKLQFKSLDLSNLKFPDSYLLGCNQENIKYEGSDLRRAFLKKSNILTFNVDVKESIIEGMKQIYCSNKIYDFTSKGLSYDNSTNTLFSLSKAGVINQFKDIDIQDRLKLVQSVQISNQKLTNIVIKQNNCYCSSENYFICLERESFKVKSYHRVYDFKSIFILLVSNDESLVFTLSESKKIHMYSLDKQSGNIELITIVIKAHNRQINFLQYLDSKNKLISISQDNEIKIWAIKGQEISVQYQVKPDIERISLIQVSPDESLLFISSQFYLCVQIWKIDENKLTEHKSIKSEIEDQYIIHACFSPDSSDLYLFLVENQIIKLNRGLDFKYDSSCDVLCNLDLSKLSGVKIIQTDVVSSSGYIFLIIINEQSCLITKIASNQILILNKIQANLSSIVSIQFSSDDNMLITGSKDSAICIWQKNDNIGLDIIKRIYQEFGKVTSLEISPCGRYLAVSYEEQVCLIYDIQNNFEIINTIEEHTSFINQLAISYDGLYLATVSDDKTCRIYSIQNHFNFSKMIDQDYIYEQIGIFLKIQNRHDLREEINQQFDKLISHKFFKFIDANEMNQNIPTIEKLIHREMTCLCFSQDNQFLAIGNEYGICQIYEVQSGFCLHKVIFPQIGDNSINSLHFSSNGLLAISQEFSSFYTIFNSQQDFQLVVRVKAHHSQINQVKFSKYSRYLATCSDDYSVKIWSVEKQFHLFNTLVFKFCILSVQFSADEKYIAAGYTYLQISHIDTGYEMIEELEGHLSAITQMKFSSDSKYFATASDDDTCRIWAADQHFSLYKILQSSQNTISCIDFSNNCKFFALSSEDRIIRILLPLQGFEDSLSIQIETNNNEDYAKSISFTNDNQYLVILTNDSDLIQIRSVENQFNLIHTIQSGSSLPECLCISKKSNLIARTCDNSFKIWDLNNNNALIFSYKYPKDKEASQIAFSPNEQLLVCVFEKIIQIWEINNDKSIKLNKKMLKIKGYVSCIEFSQDSEFLAVGFNKTCYIFQINSNLQLIQKVKSNFKIKNVAYSFNNEYLALSINSTCRIYEIKYSKELAALFKKFQGQIKFMIEAKDNYLFPISKYIL